MAHGGWRSLAHKRYDRFSLDEVLRLPAAMLAVHEDGVLTPVAPAVQSLAAVGTAAAAASTAAAAASAPQVQPLTLTNCVGRRVLCPRSRACHMHGGAQGGRLWCVGLALLATRRRSTSSLCGSLSARKPIGPCG